MTEKDTEGMVGGRLGLNGKSKGELTITSVIQAQDEEPLITSYPLSTSSEDILARTKQELEKRYGVRLKPTKARILKESLDRSKEWGAGYKVGAHLNETGVGFTFEQVPSRQTKTVFTPT